MSQNSSAKPLEETPTRRNIDVGVYLDQIEKAATEDSFKTGQLYSIPEFTREIISQFSRIRDHHRSHGLPLLTPAEVADIIIDK